MYNDIICERECFIMRNLIKFEKEITFRKLEKNNIICNIQWGTFKKNKVDTIKGIKVKLDENNTQLLQKAKALKGIKKVTIIIEGTFPVDKHLENAKVIDILSEQELLYKQKQLSHLF